MICSSLGTWPGTRHGYMAGYLFPRNWQSERSPLLEPGRSRLFCLLLLPRFFYCLDPAASRHFVDIHHRDRTCRFLLGLEVGSGLRARGGATGVLYRLHLIFRQVFVVLCAPCIYIAHSVHAIFPCDGGAHEGPQSTPSQNKLQQISDCHTGGVQATVMVLRAVTVVVYARARA